MGILHLYGMCSFNPYYEYSGLYWYYMDGIYNMTYLKKAGFHLLLMVIGFTLSFWKGYMGKFIAVLYPFLFLFVSPLAKGRENLWMFLMVLCIYFPLNQSVVSFLMKFFSYFRIFAYFAMGVLWMIEEILFGIVTRMIWPKQKSIYIHI